jgi:hypothetical protein
LFDLFSGILYATSVLGTNEEETVQLLRVSLFRVAWSLLLMNIKKNIFCRKREELLPDMEGMVDMGDTAMVDTVVGMDPQQS